MTFNQRFAQLNKAQKQAVDYIEGPLMVVAGPGTGKTELLSMRVANILNKTDTLAENILCLTFTESGAATMRRRLVEIIGKDAYKVAIHTFHSFGNEIIQNNSEYFYSGADFRPSDELTSREVLEEIFKDLPHSSLLISRNEGEYTYLSDTLKVISDLKKSGLTSDELLSILDDNELAIQKTNQLLAPVFSNKMSLKMVPDLKKACKDLASSAVKPKLLDLPALAILITKSLEAAINEAEQTNKTNNLTAWKNNWMSKNKKDQFELKATARQARLREVANIYNNYLHSMQKQKLYDYDDMILRVVHAVEVFPELRYNLQEKFSFVMVDEFQDTNLAQMRLIHSLTDSTVNGDMPNIMVVGDDDQAIYSFQGADVSNILSFSEHYPKAKLISLTENYRSGSDILSASRQSILLGENRLENKLKTLNKQLTSQKQKGRGEVIIWQSPSLALERHWLAESIKARLENGEESASIAVLTRNHKQISELLPYFAGQGVPVSYERKENILDQPPIDTLYRLARAINYLTNGRHDDFNACLSELLAHPALNVDSETLLRLSLAAYKKKEYWIEAMNSFENTRTIREWILEIAKLAPHSPLEPMLDKMIEPFKDYYFSYEQKTNDPEIFINYLVGLRTLRRKMREYRPNEEPNLASFTSFIDAHKQAGIGIELINEHAGSSGGVNIMTAHKAKGLEFDTVYIFDATDSVWGRTARRYSRKLNYPENLQIEPAGETNDERLRLFFVAMTRAKKSLNISYSLTSDGAKSTEPLEYLLGLSAEQKEIAKTTDFVEAEEQALTAWNQPLSIGHDSLKDILKPALDSYRLSATHLNSFIDITRGGPENFLIKNLLRFPEAMSPSAAFGSSVHKALNLAHQNIAAGNSPLAVEDILSIFENDLKTRHLIKKDFDHYLKKGFDCLGSFLKQNYSSFSKNQKSELDLKSQGCVSGQAQLTGKIDLIDFNGNQIIVTDYKTGKAPYSWQAKDSNEQIKLHKYRQQLIFYKLMLASSRDYSKYELSIGKLTFIEPTRDGELVELSLDISSSDMEYMSALIEAVWNKIINLDMPDISKYPKTLNGIKQFEEDLIEGRI